MSKLIISPEFFKALNECPSIYRLMWIKWLENPAALFNPLFCEKTVYGNVPKERVKECYAIGMRMLGEGFIKENNYNDELDEPPKKKKSKKDVQPLDAVAYMQVVDYLNKCAGTNYQYNNKQTIELVNSRMKEGFTKENFFTVIYKKCMEWEGTERAIYLRPATLFSPSKFESYLNQPEYAREKQGTSNAQKSANAISEAKEKLLNPVRKDG